ncbi:MAG: PQQ-binding-like beta-propeller repeat protein [Proteobacteria bacterium]|nr:PQQ-binding-like beta-propeller repeat protein [Pseudomonadota bacterium]
MLCLLAAALAGEPPVLVPHTGHAGYVGDVAFWDDWILTGSDDGTVRIWDAEGATLATLQGHRLTVDDLEVVGDRVLTGSIDGTFAVWTKTGELVCRHRVEEDGREAHATLSPDGSLVAAESEAGWVLVDLETCASVVTGDGVTGDLVWHPDGERIYRSLEGSLQVVGRDGRVLDELEGSGRWADLALSRDGAQLAVVHGRGVVVYDTDTLERVFSGEAQNDVYGLAFSADGRRLVSDGEDAMTLWDLETGEALIGAGPTRDHALAEDAPWMVTGDGNTVMVWDLDALESTSLQVPADIWALSISPDGTRFAAGHYDGSTTVVERATGDVVTVLRGATRPLTSAAWSADGRIVVGGSSDQTAVVWDMAAGELSHVVGGHRAVTRLDGAANHVAVTPDGRLFATAGDDGRVLVRDVGTGRVVHDVVVVPPTDRYSSPEWLVALDVSPDGSRMAVATSGYRVVVFDVSSGEILWVRKLQGWPGDLAFSPTGGRLVAAGDGTELLVLDAADGALVDAHDGFSREHARVGFGAFEDQLVTATDDGVVELYRGDVVQTFAGDQGGQDPVVSPNGRWLLTQDFLHERLTVWDLEQGVATLRTHADDRAAALSGDGRWAAWSVGDGVALQAVDGEERFVGLDEAYISDVALSQDGRTLAIAFGEYDEPGRIRLVDHALGDELGTVVAEDAVFVDAGLVTVQQDGAVVLRDPRSGARIGRAPRAFRCEGDVAVESEDVVLDCHDDARRLRWRPGTRAVEVVTDPTDDYRQAFSASPGGQLAWSEIDGRVHLDDGLLEAHNAPVEHLQFLDEDTLLSVGTDGLVRLTSTRDGALIRQMGGHVDRISDVQASPDGSLVASVSGLSLFVHAQDGSTWFHAPAGARGIAWAPDSERLLTWGNELILWHPGRGDPVALVGVSGSVSAAGFVRGGRQVLAVGEDGSVRAFDAATGAPLVTLVAARDGTWLVADAVGRFDTQDLGQVDFVHWRLGQEIEAHDIYDHAHTHFTPGLLRAWFEGRDLPPLPVVGPPSPTPVVGLEASTHGAGLAVLAEVCVPPGEQATGLRVFRDGALVGWSDAVLEEGCHPHRFELRTAPGVPQVEIRAHAFNTDGVKGADAAQQVPNPRSAESARPVARLLSIGVNDYPGTELDLDFAVADAQATAAALERVLGDRVAAVETTLLVSGGDEPTRDAVGRALVALGESARPEDVVVITFSGHGVARGESFHLQLADGEMDEEELRQALQAIDAGAMALVLDACNSAASVEGEGFRPGPLASGGFGQLAYDKGMAILAASQSDAVALEVGSLQHGLLTWALVVEGLDQGAADHAPADGRLSLEEWLTYGARRVPELAEVVVQGGELETSRGVSARSTPLGDSTTAPDVAQRPRLFSYGGDLLLWEPPEVELTEAAVDQRMSEELAHVSGILSAALLGNNLVCGSRDRAEAWLEHTGGGDYAFADWPEATCFQSIGWVPDARLRAVFWTERIGTSATPVIWIMMDLDQDGAVGIVSFRWTDSLSPTVQQHSAGDAR